MSDNLRGTAQLLEITPRYTTGNPFTTDAKCYRLSPPLPHTEYSDPVEYEYVIVSASDKPEYNIYETYIFACDATGKIKHWGELQGSFQGELDHERALKGAGYVVVK